MLLLVSPLYIALTAILMVLLSLRVALLRGKYGVALGDGGQPALGLAIRKFGNLSEYAAVVLLLLVVMELSGIEPKWLHAYGIVFLCLRLIHSATLFDKMDAPAWKKAGRFLSAAGTVALMIAASISLLLVSFSAS